MRRVAAAVTLLIFSSASTFGAFVVVFRPPVPCNLSNPARCDRPIIEKIEFCCGSGPVGPVEEPEPPVDNTRVVWPILLVFDPSLIPCCSDVCAASLLSDFLEQQRAPQSLPDFSITWELAGLYANPHLSLSTYFSRPVGVNPAIATTVLRC